jgi:methionyl-tRNA formyltransferase
MGDAVTGNTTMLLEAGLDTGPILLQKTLPIGATATAAEMFVALAAEGAPLVIETLAGLEAGTITPRPQDHTQATLAPILTRDDAQMDFAEHTAQQLYDRWRGFQPWPGAWTTLHGKKLIVHSMTAVEAATIAAPAAAETATLHVQQGRLYACCAHTTWLELVEIQLEGKKRMQATDFLRGTQLAAGTRLG